MSNYFTKHYTNHSNLLILLEGMIFANNITEH